MDIEIEDKLKELVDLSIEKMIESASGLSAGETQMITHFTLNALILTLKEKGILTKEDIEQINDVTVYATSKFVEKIKEEK